jgi:hypothetical protein
MIEVPNTLPLQIKKTLGGKFNVTTGNGMRLNSRSFTSEEEAKEFASKETIRYNKGQVPGPQQ